MTYIFPNDDSRINKNTPDISLDGLRNSEHFREIESTCPTIEFLPKVGSLKDLPQSLSTECREYNYQAFWSVTIHEMLEVSVATSDEANDHQLPFPTLEECLYSNAAFDCHAFSDRFREELSLEIFNFKPTTVEDILERDTDLATPIEDVTDYEDLFSALDQVNLHKIANRLRYLHEITQDDDPDDPAMEFMSLKELALFFIDRGHSLPYPQIGISPNGFLQAEWHSQKASAVLKFLPDGSTRFAGTMGSQSSRKTVQDSGTKDHALQSIHSFIDHCNC